MLICFFLIFGLFSLPVSFSSPCHAFWSVLVDHYKAEVLSVYVY